MRNTRIDKIEREYPEERIKEIYKVAREKINEQLEQFVKSFKDDKKSLFERWEDIKQLIFHVDARINYWENRRTQFLQLTAAILAASIIAVISIAPNILDNKVTTIQLIIFIPALISSLFLLIGSIRIIHIWNVQNNPNYPFTKGYVTWRWHYRHAERIVLDTNTSAYTSDSFNQQVNNFVENLTHYKEKMLKSSMEELIDQDLSQLFLLMTNEKFKIKFVSQLRDKLYKTLFAALWIAIICLVITVFITGTFYQIICQIRSLL